MRRWTAILPDSDRFALPIALLALTFLVSACSRADGGGSADSKINTGLVGTYSCVYAEKGLAPAPDDSPDVITLKADGTAELDVRNPPIAPNPGFTDRGTWTAGNDAGEIRWRQAGSEENPFRFKITRTGLFFEAKPRFRVSATECTRVGSPIPATSSSTPPT